MRGINADGSECGSDMVGFDENGYLILVFWLEPRFGPLILFSQGLLEIQKLERSSNPEDITDTLRKIIVGISHDRNLRIEVDRS